jgi:FkbM family methyltransferase
MPADFLRDRGSLEATSRRESRAVVIHPHRALVRLLGLWKLFVDPLEVSVASHLLLEGYWESWITVFLARNLRPGDHCLDVGAQFGYYSVLMGHAVGPAGRVAAVEANPALIGLLRDSLAVNGLNWCELVAAAATDEGGQTRSLRVRDSYAGGATLMGSMDGADRSLRSVEVGTVTLDQVVSEWPRLDWIKLDVEGAEQLAWRGAAGALRRFAQVQVLMEFNPAAYESADRFLDEIREFGFSIRTIDFSGDSQPVTDWQSLPPATMLHLTRG